MSKEKTPALKAAMAGGINVTFLLISKRYPYSI